MRQIERSRIEGRLARGEFVEALQDLMDLLSDEKSPMDECEPVEDAALLQLIGLSAHDRLGLSLSVDHAMLLEVRGGGLVYGLLCHDGYHGMTLFSRRQKRGLAAYADLDHDGAMHVICLTVTQPALPGGIAEEKIQSN